MQRAPPTRPPTRDVIVIGGSAGAIETLRGFVRDLPRDLPAAVFIVVHVGETSILSSVLGHCSALPVELAESGITFERGHIYVAVPGMHLLLHDDHILLRRGPRENHARPAIDALFRSAAASCGSRVMGVLLSGALSDGTACVPSSAAAVSPSCRIPWRRRCRRCRATPCAMSRWISCGRLRRCRR
jgi:two-component system chemotaxis response regulator CheB